WPRGDRDRRCWSVTGRGCTVPGRVVVGWCRPGATHAGRPRPRRFGWGRRPAAIGAARY
ncbi:MAG: hypothetical protein AVDCRST_MAG49-278, partial [uncultured Thermomicrobiales bacterium]